MAAAGLALLLTVPLSLAAQGVSPQESATTARQSGNDGAAGASPPQDTSLDDAFSLELDNGMDAGVAWPDLDAAGAEDGLVLPDFPPPATTGADMGMMVDGEDGLDAPDPSALPAGQPDQGAVLADDGSERRYQVIVNGFDDIPDSQFRGRFDSLSLLKEGEGKPANVAQINRRLAQDAELLDRILRAEGYYDATVRTAIRPPEKDGNRVRAVLTVRPGVRYTLSRISLPGLAIAAARVPMLRTAFTVEVGDPIDADIILAGQNQLALALGENGFPFASVEEPVVTIDHEIQKGDLEMVVRSGGYRRFGNIVLEDGTDKLFSSRHLYRIARFDEGDVYKASDVEDLRRAIVATGLVSSVTVEPRDSGDGEHTDIAVAASPGPMRTIAGEAGYGTGEGFRIEASWQHRNFFPPEGAITVRGLAGTREQAAGVIYRRNNFRRRDNILTAVLSARHQNLDAFEAKTLSLSANVERQTNVLYQKKWVWSVGAELIASRERDIFAGTLTETQRDYLIAALHGSVTYDASDDLLDPKRGFRIGARISPEAARQNGAFTYVRAQIDGSAYLPVSDDVVLASRIRLGTIVGGVAADRIAPSRRFYAGGGASVRGYGYQAIGPRDPNNDPLGGKSLAEFSLEARIRFGVFGVVPFIDAGNISTGFLPELDDVRYGAGVGLRYYSNFGPIRIDVGTPLNRQAGDGRIAVYVSLGQAF